MREPVPTIQEARNWARAALQEAGSETPALDADVLLAEVLGVSRTHLYTEATAKLSEVEQKQYEDFILRRRTFEPIAYILGRKEFYGRDFLVSRSVLIPRPETELLVEKALEHISLHYIGKSFRLIDVGVGSGAIILTLLSELRNRFGEAQLEKIQAIAVDLSEEALQVAKTNAESMGLEQALQFLQSDLLSNLKPASPQVDDIVVANLPYIAESDVLAPGVEKFEPRLALRSAEGGLWHINRLISQVFGRTSRTQTVLFLEIGHDQALRVESGLFELGLKRFAFFQDLQGIQRVVKILASEEMCSTTCLS